MVRLNLSLFKGLSSRYTVITRPVSSEHEEGPKKVKADLSKVKMAVSILPHNNELPDLKLHLDACGSAVSIQEGQMGNSAVTGLIVSTGNCTGISSCFS